MEKNNNNKSDDGLPKTKFEGGSDLKEIHKMFGVD